MGFLDGLLKNNFVVGDPADRFDRTNVNSGIFQVRQAITEFLTKNNPLLEETTFNAIVLWNSAPGGIVTTTPASLPLSGDISNKYAPLPATRVKIYFRVPVLHANIPIPNSFREKYTSELSKLKPEDQNELLISCHPSLYADYSEYSNLTPGDIIEIKFQDSTYTSATVLGLKQKSINNIKLEGPLSKSVEESFDEATTPVTSVASSDPDSPCFEPIPSLGKNQAKFYTSACRTSTEITTIMLHSTDGHSGSGRAQRTIKRFADGPTLRFDWTNPSTKEVVINPPCTEVLKFGPLPEGTICQEDRQAVEIPVKTSIHYAVDQGGNIIQGVLDKDIAFHAGGKMNNVSIGIEMNGKPAENPGEGYKGLYSKMYNEALITAVAKLVAGLCTKYKIPVDRTGIKGHYELYSNQETSRRFDPGNDIGWKKRNIPAGKYWNWADFLEMVKGFQSAPQSS
jgi:hypothetical protein